MAEFSIPLVWEVYGHVRVTEDTKAQAVEYALGPECPLPDGNYVYNSIRVDDTVEIEEVSENDT